MTEAAQERARLDELRQTIAMPSSDMSAGAWCETANHAVLLAAALAARLDTAEKELAVTQSRLEATNEDRRQWRERAVAAEQALRLYGPTSPEVADVLAVSRAALDAENTP